MDQAETVVGSNAELIPPFANGHPAGSVSLEFKIGTRCDRCNDGRQYCASKEGTNHIGSRFGAPIVGTRAMFFDHRFVGCSTGISNQKITNDGRRKK